MGELIVVAFLDVIVRCDPSRFLRDVIHLVGMIFLPLPCSFSRFTMPACMNKFGKKFVSVFRFYQGSITSWQGHDVLNDINLMPTERGAKQAFIMSGYGPHDIQVVEQYD